MTDEDAGETVHERGSMPSIVREFGIEGLYGYRSVRMTSEYAATILIAKNGAGKTTLLGALDAFLRGEFGRLKDLQFSHLFCSLRGYEEQLLLSHEDVEDFSRPPTSGLHFDVARRFGIEPDTLFRFVIENWTRGKKSRFEVYDLDTFVKISRGLGYSRAEASSVLDRISEDLYSRNPRINHIKSVIDAVLAEVEIVYLPTYRRVELALSPDLAEPRYRRRRPQFKAAVGSLYKADIEFGLGDIEERLRELNRDITIESNSGYTRISANIINELIDGSFDRSDPNPEDNPGNDELRLFFSRIKAGPRADPFVEPLLPNIDRIYNSDGMSENSGKFLNYFLQKLGAVIDATIAIEEPVERFVQVCNRYLSSPEPSTALRQRQIRSGRVQSDDKRMRLSRKNLRVEVRSAVGDRKIPLDALSSGEKQMVSLLAKLYLYPRDKLVLIDEPELSLSIEWQRQILSDVMNAPRCGQIIAITHSPFVFENELEPFARSLKVGIDYSALPEVDEADPMDDLDD